MSSPPSAVNSYSSMEAGVDAAPSLGYFPSGNWAGRILCAWVGDEGQDGGGKGVFSSYSDNDGDTWSLAARVMAYPAGGDGGLPNVGVKSRPVMKMKSPLMYANTDKRENSKRIRAEGVCFDVCTPLPIPFKDVGMLYFSCVLHTNIL